MSDHGADAMHPGDPASAWGIGPPPAADPSAEAAQSPASPFQVGPSDGLLTVRGLALGAVAAVAGAALWMVLVALTNYQIGIAAVGVALLVAGAVRVGSGGLSGVPVRVGSVALTVVSMALAEYLVVRHFVNAELAAEGAAESVPLLISPLDLVLVVVESLRFDPLTLVFWAIAVFAAWRVSAPNES
jgi:hypothetical protein